MFFPLDGPIRNYSWGSLGLISGFRGSAGSGETEAEQWFGNHPESKTVIEVAGEHREFYEWLSETHTDFPLLVKLLAAEQPLSIQAHPGAQQAQEGFVAEEEKGVAEELRTYRDASAKPELLVALSPDFRALVGFVGPQQLGRRLELFRGAGLDPATCEVMTEKLLENPAEGVSWVLENGPEVQHCLAVIQQWAENVPVFTDESVSERAELELVRDLCALYPHDPGVLLSVLMHHVILGRAEALFVDAGVVHAYLHGFGLEVMLPSDNVVRAGLTQKNRDIQEFLKIADTSALSEPPIVRPREHGVSKRYDRFNSGFSVTHLTGAGGVTLANSPAVVVVEDSAGPGVLRGNLSEIACDAGDVFYASEDEGTLTTTGLGSVWVVHPTNLAG